MSDQTIEIEATELLVGMRIDKALSEHLNQHSRSAIQQWIRQGQVTLNGQPVQPKTRLSKTDKISVSIPQVQPAEWPAQQLDLDIVYQDQDIMVINKAAGMVVHPGAGNPDHTLMNGVLFLDPQLGLLPRAGIVHRLDKDTTGLMVLARNEPARRHLIDQLKSRSMHRSYLACVNGRPIAGGEIDQPIGRNRRDRLKMAVTSQGKPAVTHYRIIEKFKAHSLIRAQLQSGRTHQIRVHMAWQGYPLIGDPLYGGRLRMPADASPELIHTLQQFSRQALHAEKLSLIHPASGEQVSWQKPVPEDMADLIEKLRDN